MYTNIIHNDDICNYFLKNQQFIFNSLGNCRECRLHNRVERVCARQGISAEEAEKLISKKDRRRQEYYNFFTFAHWGEAANYDLCIDSSILGIEKTAELIIEFCRVSGKLPTD